MTKLVANVKWEMFQDDSFFGMWAIRPKEDKDFNSPRLFHFALKEDAESFKLLIEKSHLSVPNNKV